MCWLGNELRDLNFLLLFLFEQTDWPLELETTWYVFATLAAQMSWKTQSLFGKGSSPKWPRWVFCFSCTAQRFHFGLSASRAAKHTLNIFSTAELASNQRRTSCLRHRWWTSWNLWRLVSKVRTFEKYIRHRLKPVQNHWQWNIVIESFDYFWQATSGFSHFSQTNCVCCHLGTSVPVWWVILDFSLTFLFIKRRPFGAPEIDCMRCS